MVTGWRQGGDAAGTRLCRPRWVSLFLRNHRKGDGPAPVTGVESPGVEKTWVLQVDQPRVLHQRPVRPPWPYHRPRVAGDANCVDMWPAQEAIGLHVCVPERERERKRYATSLQGRRREREEWYLKREKLWCSCWTLSLADWTSKK